MSAVSKRTRGTPRCCGCIPLRRGILALQAVQIVIASLFLALLTLVTVALDDADTSGTDLAVVPTWTSKIGRVKQASPSGVSQSELAAARLAMYVAIGYFVALWLFGCFGIYCVVRARVTGFKVVAGFTVVSAGYSLVTTCMDLDVASLLLALLSVYWAYMYLIYLRVMTTFQAEHDPELAVQAKIIVRQ
ncbi:hypothetical protein BC828DRAFT_388414 [Blastocladiella britannica]|nr:hypothetical protein BC828DRAFT_388414 [Blastocladiella britannica]